MGKIPKEIATFLNLDDPNLYTGHAFRRTSATVVADEGADLLTLKRHGVWKSDTVAESYVNESIKNKMDISNMISSAINLNNTKVKVSSTTKKPATITRKPLTDKNINDIRLPAPLHQTTFNFSTSKPNIKALYSRNVNAASKPKLNSDVSLKRKYSDLDMQLEKLTQINTDEFDNITQEELQEVVSNDFQREDFTREVQLQREKEYAIEIENITQEELKEVTSTAFFPLLMNSKSNVKPRNEKKHSQQLLHGITQAELEETATTDFLGNRLSRKKAIYVFKNCNFTINQK